MLFCLRSPAMALIQQIRKRDGRAYRRCLSSKHLLDKSILTGGWLVGQKALEYWTTVHGSNFFLGLDLRSWRLRDGVCEFWTVNSTRGRLRAYGSQLGVQARKRWEKNWFWELLVLLWKLARAYRHSLFEMNSYWFVICWFVYHYYLVFSPFSFISFFFILFRYSLSLFDWFLLFFLS